MTTTLNFRCSHTAISTSIVTIICIVTTVTVTTIIIINVIMIVEVTNTLFIKRILQLSIFCYQSTHYQIIHRSN